jgi:hypothetical protein
MALGYLMSADGGLAGSLKQGLVDTNAGPCLSLLRFPWICALLSLNSKSPWLEIGFRQVPLVRGNSQR